MVQVVGLRRDKGICRRHTLGRHDQFGTHGTGKGDENFQRRRTQDGPQGFLGLRVKSLPRLPRPYGSYRKQGIGTKGALSTFSYDIAVIFLQSLLSANNFSLSFEPIKYKGAREKELQPLFLFPAEFLQ
jgi:hypothetical protein